MDRGLKEERAGCMREEGTSEEERKEVFAWAGTAGKHRGSPLAAPHQLGNCAIHLPWLPEQLSPLENITRWHPEEGT